MNHLTEEQSNPISKFVLQNEAVPTPVIVNYNLPPHLAMQRGKEIYHFRTGLLRFLNNQKSQNPSCSSYNIYKMAFRILLKLPIQDFTILTLERPLCHI